MKKCDNVRKHFLKQQDTPNPHQKEHGSASLRDHIIVSRPKNGYKILFFIRTMQVLIQRTSPQTFKKKKKKHHCSFMALSI